MLKKYLVTLTEQERELLRALVSRGKSAARKLNHARVLLLADASQRPARTDEEIVEALGLGVRTVERVRQRFVQEGFEAGLNPRPRPRRARKLEEQIEADVIALAAGRSVPAAHEFCSARAAGGEESLDPVRRVDLDVVVEEDQRTRAGEAAEALHHVRMAEVRVLDVVHHDELRAREVGCAHRVEAVASHLAPVIRSGDDEK